MDIAEFECEFIELSKLSEHIRETLTQKGKLSDIQYGIHRMHRFSVTGGTVSAGMTAVYNQLRDTVWTGMGGTLCSGFCMKGGQCPPKCFPG